MASRRDSAAFLFAKRAIDLAGASLALVVLLPVTALICVVVKLGSHGPVLFRQRRLGKGGVPFTLFKFRTMQDGAPLVQFVHEPTVRRAPIRPGPRRRLTPADLQRAGEAVPAAPAPIW